MTNELNEIININFKNLKSQEEACVYIKNNNSEFSCISLNVRSMRTNWNAFVLYVDDFLSSIDVIMLCEINITKEENHLYEIEGYNREFFNRSNSGGGGVAVYIKNDVLYEKVERMTNLYENISLNVKRGNFEASIISIYRPPKSNVNCFIRELSEHVDAVGARRNLIVMGDVNINIKDENNTYVCDYLSMIASKGLHNSIFSYTRVDPVRNTKTLIDHNFLRVKNAEIKSAVVELYISDHYALYCGVNPNTITQKKTDKERQILSHIVAQKINDFNWDELNLFTDVNEFYQHFKQTINTLVTSSTVLKKKRSTEHSWITTELKNDCKERDRLYRRYKNNRQNEDYHREYKLCRNELNKKIARTKACFYKQKFQECKNNPKETWKLVNSLLGKKPSNLDDILKKNFANEKDFKDLANRFANTLSSEVLNIVHECNQQTFFGHSNSVQHSIYAEHVSVTEVQNILNSLNCNKSAGIDEIRPKDLKINAQTLSPVITKLINMSIDQASIPYLLKMSIVRPIYKSGKKNEILNYRPISILSAVDKVMEEVLAKRLYEYVEKYKILEKNQFGFRKNKSINRLLGDFANKLYQSLDKNHNSVVLFIDFKKAFDTLSHKQILRQLGKIGVRGDILAWFESYLRNRTFKVKIGEFVSEEENVTYGVPQGSKLGPLLFIIYVNDLLSVLKYSTGYAYADDTAIVVSHRSVEEAARLMQVDFNGVTAWCHDHGLIINALKTKVMHIRPPRIPKTKLKIKMHDIDCLHRTGCNDLIREDDDCSGYIENVSTYKYLGLTVDYNFKWSYHIEALKKKLCQSAYALFHLSNLCTPTVLKQCYFGLVESHLRYGILAWGRASQMQPLQRLQARLQKIVQRARHNSEEQHHRNQTTNMLNISQIYNLEILANFYNDNTYRTQTQQTVNTRRRQQQFYEIPRYWTEYGRRTYNVAVPMVLNELPREFRNLTKNEVLKKVKEIYLRS